MAALSSSARRVRQAMLVLSAAVSCSSATAVSAGVVVVGRDGREDLQVADEPVAGEDAGRVRVEVPVGQVRVGPDTVEAGRRIHATRSLTAGSASMVSLSSSQQLSVRSGDRPTVEPLRPTSLAVTGKFGEIRPTGRGGFRAHAGIDLAARAGSPVSAMYDGRVVSAGWAGSYGLLVVLEHVEGVETRYAHLSHLLVAAGQQVRRGEVIGLVGSTGRSTGPHLHYEVRRHGIPVNPMSH